MNPLVTSLVLFAKDSTPEDENVVAGGWGAALFVFLIIAGVLLSWSLAHRLRKARANREAGRFDERPVRRIREDDELADS